MINKFFIAIIISVTLAHCGFSPIYTGNSKEVIISRSEIVGDKDLAFNLERKLNFTKDEKNLNAYIFKAQIMILQKALLWIQEGYLRRKLLN